MGLDETLNFKLMDENTVKVIVERSGKTYTQDMYVFNSASIERIEKIKERLKQEEQNSNKYKNYRNI